jgi:hypothetical protein
MSSLNVENSHIHATFFKGDLTRRAEFHDFLSTQSMGEVNEYE